jgi:hypothetical protein
MKVAQGEYGEHHDIEQAAPTNRSIGEPAELIVIAISFGNPQ